MAAAAKKAGCGRIVYLGGVKPRGEPSEHLASRLEVGELLRASDVVTVELRAAMIVGEGSTSWQIVRDLAMRLPFMVLPKWLESRSCPIALKFARELVLGLTDDLLPEDDAYWALTGHTARTSFRDAADRALENEPRQPGMAGWLARSEEAIVRRF